MKKLGFVLQIVLLAMLCGCSSQSEVSKSRLTTGYYRTKNHKGSPVKRYVLIKNDTIWSYPINPADKQIIDSARASAFVYPKESDKLPPGKYAFNKRTWDFNFQ